MTDQLPHNYNSDTSDMRLSRLDHENIDTYKQR